MRSVAKILLWLATALLLIAALTCPAFGQYTARHYTNADDTIHVNQHATTTSTGAPNGTYGVRFHLTCAGTPSGCNQDFGNLDCTITVSGGVATMGTCHYDGSGGEVLKSGTVNTFMPCNSGGVLTLTMQKNGGAWTNAWALNQDGPITVTRLDVGTTGTATTVTAPVNWSIGAAIAGSAHLTGNLKVGKQAKAHTLQLKYNGTVVQTANTPANSSNVTTAAIDFLNSTAYTGDTFEWLVDGVSQGGVQTVTLVNIGTPEAPNWFFSNDYEGTLSGGDGPTPTPTTTPTPTPYATATPTVTPVAGTPPPTIIKSSPGGSTVYSMAVTVVNPQDIYNPIVNDLDKVVKILGDNSSNSNDNSDVVNKLDEMEHSGSSPPGSATDDHETSNFDTRGHLDDLQTSTDSIVSGKTDIVNALTDTINSFLSDAAALSGSTFGSTLTIPMPFTSIGNAPAVGKVALPNTIDLSDWSGLISLLRTVLLWLLRIAFWVLVYKLFSAHGIQAT